jgi:hypothetical protein
MIDAAASGINFFMSHLHMHLRTGIFLNPAA